ncbi:hypothetical protein [Arthrobacter sp. GMC3]|uniref:DUF7316 family protein n=1 Tax=Arthrobacter sp. GMC3 TaxID=2058894 RepID=UPI000CE4224C|nr:hypothetical protein [Arthrobacter sp. GMC3]
MSEAATTETRTEYGIRKPNGDIQWDRQGRYLDVDIKGAALGIKTYDGRKTRYVEDGRGAMEAAMRDKAKAVGVVQEDFVRGHEYVSQDIVTITMAPVIVAAPAGPTAQF